LFDASVFLSVRRALSNLLVRLSFSFSPRLIFSLFLPFFRCSLSCPHSIPLFPSIQSLSISQQRPPPLVPLSSFIFQPLASSRPFSCRRYPLSPLSLPLSLVNSLIPIPGNTRSSSHQSPFSLPSVSLFSPINSPFSHRSFITPHTSLICLQRTTLLTTQQQRARRAVDSTDSHHVIPTRQDIREQDQ